MRLGDLQNLGPGWAGRDGPRDENLYPAVPDDEDREVFELPVLIQTLLEKKLLGDKTKGGFFKKSKTAKANW